MSQLQRAEASQFPRSGSESLTPQELQIAGIIVAYSIMYDCSLSDSVDDYEDYPNGVSAGLDPETAARIKAHLGCDLDDGRGDY